MKTCRFCEQSFAIENADRKFFERFNVPEPTLCPPCRCQRRLCFRNESALYNRTCDLCKAEMISLYSPQSKYKIYCPKCWWSDRWSPLEYGRSYQAGKSFFAQFGELLKTVPRIALHVTSNENSDYINLSGYNKDCYMIFSADYCQKCLYSNMIVKSVRCLDVFFCRNSEYCYEVTDVSQCNRLWYSFDCRNCADSIFLADCRGCVDCLLCTNLRNQNYCVRNQKLSPAAYRVEKEKILVALRAGRIEPYRAIFRQLCAQMKRRALLREQSENSQGHRLFAVKNVQYGFDVEKTEDSRYINQGGEGRDLMDVDNYYQGEIVYEGQSVGYRAYNVKFAVQAWSTKNSEYIDAVHSSADCFGCTGVKRGQYLLLNRELSAIEYESMLKVVKADMLRNGEYGEFFPSELSPYVYKETVAADYFPRQGKTIDPVAKQPRLVAGLPHCTTCGKAFRIIPAEKAFYQEVGLAEPDRCPNCRQKARFAARPGRRLFSATCADCRRVIQTVYRSVPVYCDDCYRRAIA